MWTKKSRMWLENFTRIAVSLQISIKTNEGRVIFAVLLSWKKLRAGVALNSVVKELMWNAIWYSFVEKMPCFSTSRYLFWMKNYSRTAAALFLSTHYFFISYTAVLATGWEWKLDPPLKKNTFLVVFVVSPKMTTVFSGAMKGKTVNSLSGLQQQISHFLKIFHSISNNIK